MDQDHSSMDRQAQHKETPIDNGKEVQTQKNQVQQHLLQSQKKSMNQSEIKADKKDGKEQLLKKIFQEFQITEQYRQEFVQNIDKGNMKQCLQYTSKSKRKNLQALLTKYKSLSEEKMLIPTQQEFLASIFSSKYGLGQQDLKLILTQCQFNQQNIDEYVQCAHRKYRQPMKKQIIQYFDLLNKHAKPKIDEVKLIENLKSICLKYGIEESELQQCLEGIKNNDPSVYLDFINKSKRLAFQNSIEACLSTSKKNVNQKVKQAPKDQVYLLRIKYGDILQQVKVLNIQQLKQRLIQSFDIAQLQQYQIFVDGKQTENLENIFKQKKTNSLLKFIKKIEVKYQFKGKIFSIWANHIANSSEITKMVQADLVKKQIVELDKHNVIITISNQRGQQVEMANLGVFIKQFSVLKITVEIEIQIFLFYQDQKSYKMKTSQTLRDLKALIEKDYSLPFQSQSLQYQKDEKRILFTEADIDRLLQSFIENDSYHLSISLTNHRTMEYFGFQSNHLVRYMRFSQFLVQSEESLNFVIRNIDFKNSQAQTNFFNSFVKFLFSSVKKRFPIQIIIDKVRDLVVKKKFENIWVSLQQDKPRKMNQSFVLMYLLRNSDQLLKIELMNLVKNMIPLPLYIKQFKNIFDNSSKPVLNNQLLWILQNGLTICSLGLHNSNPNQQKGKSQLLNNLFYTNFCPSENKHHIIDGIPFVSVKVFDDFFPLNIIDIPSNCDQTITNSIIVNSDVVFIHSWKSQSETEKFMQSFPKRNSTFCLIRDIKEINREFLKYVNSIDLTKQKVIKIPNLAGKESNKAYVDIIREKINIFLSQYKNTLMLSDKIFKICCQSEQYQQFLKLNEIVKSFSGDNTKICQFTQYSMAIEKQRKTQEQKKIIEELQKKQLSKAILNFFSFLQKSKLPSNIILIYFRQKLRSFQNQNISKYMIFYKIKQKLLFNMHKKKQFFQIANEAQKQLKEKKIPSSQALNFSGISQDQVIKKIEHINNCFENQIKPKLFSIELFWREVYAFAKIKPNFQIGNTLLNQLVQQLKSSQVLCNQPFELIDGDSLQMPKKVVEKVFSGISTQKCLVIAIIGPQSSGKSTLLNFLFGCDFSTSQGRCTRGLYGTYFRISDQRINNFEGIFVIDTEGLFPITNDVDEKFEDRKNFDSKLVLFCLAVADIVIINVRGNLDKNTQKILNVCNQKLELIGQSEEKKPSIIIVLNQNNTSKTQQSENEFKKIRKTFSFSFGRSLSLAYDIKNYTNNDILLLQQNQVLSKKTPLSRFHQETENLLKQMIQKMKKCIPEDISTKINKFFQIWSTVLSFPNLSEVKSKQYRRQENIVKEWRKNQEDQINKQLQQLFISYKSDKISQNHLKNNLRDINERYIEDFDKQFSNIVILNCQVKQLINKQRKQIIQITGNNQSRVHYQIQKTRVDRNLSKERFEGDARLRQLQKVLIKKQSNGQECTLQQKNKMFNQCFQESLSKIQQTIKLKNIPENQLQRIWDLYIIDINNSQSQIKQLGLLKNEKQQILKIVKKYNYNEFEQFIQQKLQKEILKDHKLLMTYTDKPYTNVLKSGKYDAQLKYFNMRDYFEKRQRQKIYNIDLKDLVRSFTHEQFISQLKEVLEIKHRQINKKSRKLSKIYQIINNYLVSSFSISLLSEDMFKNVYQSEKANILLKAFRYLYGEKRQKLFLIRLNLREKIFSIKETEQHKRKAEKFLALHPFDVFNQNQKNSLCTCLKPLDFIAKKIRQNIKWSEVENYLEYSNQYVSEVNIHLVNQINKDLLPLNMQIDFSTNLVSIVQLSGHNLQKMKFKIFQSVHSIDPKRIISNQQYFQQSFNNMKFFQVKTIKQSVKSNLSYNRSNDFAFEIGKYKYEVLEPVSKEFQGYQQSGKQIKMRFQQNSFQEFIFNQLNSKKSISVFFNQIFKIVRQTYQKWGKFTPKAISQVFFLVNQEICQFNNDLNQISHQLNHIFVGKVHSSAIHLIWKCQVDLLMKQQRELYQKKQQARQSQYKRFLIRTSNDTNKIIENEVDEMLQKLGEQYEKKVRFIKQELKINISDQFNKKVHRPLIQKQLDIQIYSKGTQPEIVLQYLENPHEFINKKYLQNYQQKYQQFQRQFNRKNNFQQCAKQLLQAIQILGRALQNDKISQQKGTPNDLFQSSTRNSQRNDYDQQAKKILFQYFIDKLTGDNEEKQRVCEDITLHLRFKYTKIKSLDGIMKEVLSSLKGKGLKITNIMKFLSIMKRQQSQMKLLQNFKKLCSFTANQQKQFINKIRVIVCKEKCPCCGRICGQENAHNFHQCIYGHQMRALAGNHIMKNGKKEAYVARCQNLSETDLMEYNGNQYTWTKFKDYWAKKPVGGWRYDDLKDNVQENKSRFQNAWLLAGPTYCKKNGMQYVDFNMANQQLKQLIPKAHFIFALDISGSMYSIWPKLSSQLEEILKNISIYQKENIEIKVSIITFSTEAQIVYERAKPKDVKLSSIQCRKDGTNFENPFQQAYNIGRKYISNQMIIFVFMTDGYAQFPFQGIEMLKKLKKKNQKNFKYAGIQYSQEKIGLQITEFISNELGGLILKAENFEQLLKAYSKCIQIIAYRQDKQQQPSQNTVGEH